MIFAERTIRVSNGTSSISSPIILYKGDKNIKIRFKVVDCPYTYSKNVNNFIETSEASYAQLIIKTPNNGTPILSDVVEPENGYVTFIITGEMIDEAKEVGKYSLQIRLLDDEQYSRITIPEVVDGIEVREPMVTEGVSATNEVDVAVVDYAVTTAGTAEDAFDSQGNYIKTNWKAGGLITAAKLNKIEAGIEGVNQKVASEGSNRYVTKETGNANQITFRDGQTFQEKYDSGMLTGPQGEIGPQGPQGIQGVQGPAGKDAAIPNFTFAINMIAANSAPSVVTSGTYPDLVFTFNIPQGAGGTGEVVCGNIIAPGSITFLAGGSTTFDVKLDRAPTSDQVVLITPTKCTIDKTSLVFTASNYNIPQTISVTAKNASNTKIVLSSPNVPDVEIAVAITNEPVETTTYTVTNNLTNCTTNNSAASVDEGTLYSATISANSGYNMGSIAVTMGGTNITSSAVSGNTVTISNVTGNIVITASATQQSSSENVIYDEAGRTLTINNATYDSGTSAITIPDNSMTYNESSKTIII